MKLLKSHAKKVVALVDKGLVSGLGNPRPGEMCVEACVCYALGLPHGDDPKCVSPALRKLKITLNDYSWSTNSARAKGLRRLAVAQLGSNVIDDTAFARAVAEMTIRTVVPRALRHAASVHTVQEHKDKLEAAAVRCETAADAAAWNAAAAAAADAAGAAADDAAMSAGDAELATFAESVVQILIDLKAPGCKWLDLVPLKKITSRTTCVIGHTQWA